MRKTCYILFVFSISLLFLFQCNSDEKALNKRLNKMASEINESAPVMLDQYTRFEGAFVLPENVFQYRYTIIDINNPDSLVDAGLPSLLENIHREFSSNPQLDIFKASNVVVEYVYMSEENRVIHSFRINPEDYN